MTATHVLVCYRASRQANRALRAAVSLAGDTGARLTVLLPTARPAKGPRCCGIQDAQWNELVGEALDEELATAQKIVDGSAVRVEFARAEGESVADAVREYARRAGCDLIVLPRTAPYARQFTRSDEDTLATAQPWQVVRLPDRPKRRGPRLRRSASIL